MKNLFIGSVIAAAVFAAVPAQAYTTSFASTNTNVVGGDFSGKTSPLASAANNSTGQNGLFVETFDRGIANGGCGLITPEGQVTITGGNYDIRQGTKSGVAAAPAGDSTCFAFGPAEGQGKASTVNIDYTNLLSGLGPNASLNYLGLYYGSIDTYNDLDFFDANKKLIVTVTGKELIDLFKGQSGNQTADSSNIYVNLFFTPAEQFTSFSFRTTGIAFEMDNLAIGFNISAVPEPGSLALLGLGLGALGLSRRRKANAA